MKRVLFHLAISLIAFSAISAQNKKQVTIFSDSLSPLRNVQLDEVVVNATKVLKGTPMAYTNFSKEEIARNNFGQDVPYLIAQTPSVVVTSDAGTGIGYIGFRVRGTDANRININVNGVPVNDAESHTLFWVNMPDFASSVENIQIQRGAGTSTNGAAAFGATISMQTQNLKSKPNAEYSTTVGSFNTYKQTAKMGTGLIKDHFVVDGRFSLLKSDGFIDRATANMYSYHASAAYYGTSTLVKFQTFGSNEHTYQAWGGVPATIYGVPTNMLKDNRTYNPAGEYEENSVTKYYENQTDNYAQQHYHLMASQRFSAALNGSITLHYTKGAGYYEDYKANAELEKYKLPIFTDADGKKVKESDLVRQKWLDNDFYGAVFGLNYKTDKLQTTWGGAVNNYVGNHFGKVIWVKNIRSLDPFHPYYDSDANKLDYNTYVKANYLFLPSLNGYIDLQYRGINYRVTGEDDKAGALDITKNYNFFNPKAGLNFEQNGHNAFASFSVANREPNRNNFTEAGVNERPTFETLYDYELGYSYTAPIFNVGINLYYMDYNNQLILTGKISGIGEPLTANIKDSYRMGIELMAGAKITSWLTWGGNLTLSQNKIMGFTDYTDDWDNGGQKENYIGTTEIAFSPSIIANSMFNFYYKGFSAAFNSSFVGRQYIDNTSSKERSIDPYFVNNLQLGYTYKPRFIESIAIDFSINNLFNEQYETNAWVYSYYEGGVRKKSDGFFTQAGTHVMGRLTLKF